MSAAVRGLKRSSRSALPVTNTVAPVSARMAGQRPVSPMTVVTRNTALRPRASVMFCLILAKLRFARIDDGTAKQPIDGKANSSPKIEETRQHERVDLIEQQFGQGWRRTEKCSRSKRERHTRQKVIVSRFGHRQFYHAF